MRCRRWLLCCRIQRPSSGLCHPVSPPADGTLQSCAAQLAPASGQPPVPPGGLTPTCAECQRAHAHFQGSAVMGLCLGFSAPAVLPVPTKMEVPSLDGPPGAQIAAQAQNETFVKLLRQLVVQARPGPWIAVLTLLIIVVA